MAEFNNSFVFYRSFYDAMKLLDNDDKSDFINLICELAFNGVEPDFKNTGYSDLVKVAYTISAEQIKASVQHKLDGLKGGRPKKESIEKGVKTPLLTPLKSNVNVNVNDNVNVKVNDNVNKDFTDDDETQNKNFLLDFVTEFQNKHGFNFGKKTINKLMELAPVLSFEDQLNLIKSKYPDKTGDELARLFVASLSWEETKPKETTKKTKNINIYAGAPKICTRCGSKVVKWAGVYRAVICNNCRTYWEFDEGGANVWKCSRGE